MKRRDFLKGLLKWPVVGLVVALVARKAVTSPHDALYGWKDGKPMSLEEVNNRKFRAHYTEPVRSVSPEWKDGTVKFNYLESRDEWFLSEETAKWYRHNTMMNDENLEAKWKAAGWRGTYGRSD